MIEARELTFGYRRSQPVINRWSAVIEPGEAVAVVGPSGCGKSTLLYLLGMLVRPWSGHLRIAGRPVERLRDAARSDIRASQVGLVFQDALLDPRRSVLDNVVEGAVYRGAPRRSAVARAQPLLESLGVDVELGRRATDLSGGQAQRVAVCRALLNDPVVVLADEPTGNLDQVNARVVEDALFSRARRGASLLIVTHDEAMAARCDRTYRI